MILKHPLTCTITPLLVALLFCGIATAQTSTTAPSAPKNYASGLTIEGQGIAGDGVTIDDGPLQELLNSVPASGATVQIGSGRYLLNAPLRMQSNTRLVCLPGATFVAAKPWTKDADEFLLKNRNFAAHTITDHDITVMNCEFDLRTRGGASGAIGFRMARHIRISQVKCFDGGDCTALLATDDTIVENSYATDIVNACWDHWEAPTNGSVRGGYCRTRRHGAGLFITGAGGRVPNEVAKNFSIDGGTYFIGGDGVGIWVMGLGKPGDNDGATNVRITGTHIDLGASGHPCIKVSGATSDVAISNFACKGGAGAAIYAGSGGDGGGNPSRLHIVNGTIDGAHAASGNLIQIDADDSLVEGIRVTNSSAYIRGIYLGGRNDIGRNNSIPRGQPR